MWTGPFRQTLSSSLFKYRPPAFCVSSYTLKCFSATPERSSSTFKLPPVPMPSAYKFANDQIFIDNLNLKCLCGPNAFGKLKPQQVLLSVKLGTSIARAARHDRVDLSVDYSALAKDLMAFEGLKFKSVAEMLENVTVLGVEKYGVQKLSVKAQVPKGQLQAANTTLERTAWVDDGVKGEWKYKVEGIEVPIIIGIKENAHERTHKQHVCIDLEWHAFDQVSVATHSETVNDLVNCIVESVSKTSYESLESLASLIAAEAFGMLDHITVTIRKPSALPFADASGIRITRWRTPRDAEQEKEVYIALGSNLGDRLHTLHRALQSLNNAGIQVLDVSSLYESEPMYVEEQPQFLNAARTTLTPRELLATLKKIEIELGRRPTIRNGPRTLDLDILLYGRDIVTEEDLIIPHLSMLERGFVLQPLADVASDLIHPTTHSSIRQHLEALPPPTQYNYLSLPLSSPLNFDVYHHRIPTVMMAILNLTPDSFSDGGKHSLDSAQIVETVRQMVEDGAQIIDVGGQSTRPNAIEVSIQEEIDRVVPAITAIRQAGLKVPISIDTYRAKVAEAAMNAGADIINDVSAGLLDDNMLSTAAKLNTAIILMHMRGTPQNMNAYAKYDGDLIEIIGRELRERVEEAVKSGIRRWNIILDPGLGFAKTGAHNIEIIRRLDELRRQPGLNGMPWLLGPSRKRFIERITGEKTPCERRWGTAGAVAACVQGGADIIRIHDTKEMSKVVKMSDAIWRNV